LFALEDVAIRVHEVFGWVGWVVAGVELALLQREELEFCVGFGVSKSGRVQ